MEASFHNDQRKVTDHVEKTKKSHRNQVEDMQNAIEQLSIDLEKNERKYKLDINNLNIEIEDKNRGISSLESTINKLKIELERLQETQGKNIQLKYIFFMIFKN